MLKYIIFFVTIFLLSSCSENLIDQSNIIKSVSEKESPPIEPYFPVPSKSQLDWQDAELVMFIHFGMNTFTDKEWGDGSEDPTLFNPTRFDAEQWVKIAKEIGFKYIILTA